MTALLEIGSTHMQEQLHFLHLLKYLQQILSGSNFCTFYTHMTYGITTIVLTPSWHNLF